MQRPFKVVVTGAESTGKTTLAQALGAHYGCAYVPEYAREYLTHIKTNYQEKDLVEIARGQLAAQHACKAAPVQIFDTDLQVIKIWSLVKYSRVDEYILEQYALNPPDLYILCAPDNIEWEYDELRENQYDVHELHQRYVDELDAQHVPYITATGNMDARKNFCINYIDSKISH